MGWQAMFRKAPPRECIAFIIGGSTYEEDKAVAEFNERQAALPGGGMRVVLGGTGVLNSAQFLAALTAPPLP